MVSVLILEQDPWRFRGIECVLEDSGVIEVLGAADFASVLTMEKAPEDLHPDVILLAHRLVVEYGIALVPNLREVFSAAVLVYGEEDSLELTAQLLAAGAKGFFLMSSPSLYLINALGVVNKGKFWGPREAVALMGERKIPQADAAQETSSELTRESVTMLRFLNEGLTNKEIASRLGVAEVTVKSKLGRLYRQFGVTTRLQLLSKAFRKGIIGPSTIGVDDPRVSRTA